jgi:cytidylate kinase
MNVRDENDRTRTTAPAIAAGDAIVLDNSLLTREETLAAAIGIIEEKSAK